VEETVPLVAALLSLALPTERYPPLTLSPERQKQKTVEVLLTWLLKAAEQQPVCVMLEDLHWGDPSTLEFLTLLIDQVPTTRLLVLLLARPEFRPLWALRAHLTQITLSRLSRHQVETMIAQITSGKALSAEVLQQIVTKTDGVPLFVEELTKMVLEAGWLREQEGHYALTSPLPPLAIPATLHDSLMARLDRLATAKSVAQLGATLGRAFPYELLRAVSPWDEATLQHELARLGAVELLYQRGVPPQATYSFKHVLIQEAAYQSLLKSTRQRYHQRIAQVLEAQFPDTAETQPELLAHHYTEAGCKEQAVDYWQRAGQHASERSAYVEAIHHLTKGLDVLQTLPETSARARQELMLHLTLGPAFLASRGYSAAEVEQVYTRARALCQQLGEIAQLFPVLGGLWQFYLSRAHIQTARELAEQLLHSAQEGHGPALLVAAHDMLGQTLWYLGELAPARAHLEQAIARYDAQQHRALALMLGGEDPGVACRDFVAWALWGLGYPEQACKRMQEALTLAQALSSPFAQALALGGATLLHQFRREEHATQERAEALITFASERGVAYWLAWGMFLRGWALARQGQGEEGIAQMGQGLAAMRATAAADLNPYWLALLAEAYGDVGQTDAGLSMLAEALALGDHTGERVLAAELHRLKGELILQSGNRSLESGVWTPDAGARILAAEAEACFHQALDVARRQQAKSWELRAAMSLSRLWQQQGKGQEAHDLLAPIYAWFTEGFDTADLQEAKALLVALR
jgi:predicted ATPase